MAKNNNIGDLLQSVANAIRTRKGTTEPINAQNFDQEILDIPSGMNSIDETADVIKACGGEMSYDDATLANGVAKLFADEPTEQAWNGTRVTADGAAVRDGVAYVKGIKGKTIKLYQFNFQRLATVTNTLGNGVTVISDPDGKHTCNGLASGNNSGVVLAQNFSWKQGRKYLLYSGHRDLFVTQNSNWYYEVAYILSPASDKDNATVSLRVRDGIQYNNTVAYPMSFDLTEMFGAGNEPTTPDEFAQRLGYATIEDVPYIPYTETPQLMSLTASGVKSVGKNLATEEYTDELTRATGWKKNGDGSYTGMSNQLYIYTHNNTVFGGLFKKRAKYSITAWFSFLDGSTDWFSMDAMYSDGTHKGIGLSANSGVLRFVTDDTKDITGIQTGYSTGKNMNLRIHIEYGDNTNASYAKPMTDTLPLPIDQIEDGAGNKVFPHGLLSVGNVHDEIDLERGIAVKRIMRYEDVFLYKAIWNAQSTYSISVVRFPNMEKVTNAVCNVLNSVRSGLTVQSMIDGLCKDYDFKANGDGYIYIQVPFKTEAEVTNWFNVNKPIIYYPLDSPIEYPLLPTAHYYKVQQNGMEELVRESINLWNEEWEVGFWWPIAVGTTPAKGTNTQYIRTKEYIPVKAGTEYYISIPNASERQIIFVDKDGVSLNQVGIAQSAILTAPVNAVGMYWYCKPIAGATYEGNICVNISNAGINGKYEKYGAIYPAENSAPLIADIGYRGMAEAQALNLL